MLKKKTFVFFMAVLSFLMLFFTGCETQETTETVKEPKLKMYLVSQVSTPKKLTYTSGAKEFADILYDGDTINTIPCKDSVITADMGKNILLSKVRYYAGAIENNNCLGTRFYASKNGRDYTELGVVNEVVPPENNWYEISFGGFGEYRYFRAEIPENSNITEIEWIEANGFSVMPKNRKYDITLSLCGFDALEDIEATVVLASYDKYGVLKQEASSTQTFLKGEPLFFEAQLKGVDKAAGDTYRVSVFNDELITELNYTINDASYPFEVASVFSDNMLIQAEKPFIIWGKGIKGESVEVEVANTLGGGIFKRTTVDKNSKWEIDLGSFSQGGDYTITIKSTGQEYKLKDITFGDVWLCTGQSNMDRYMVGAEETEKELKSPEVSNPNIRIFNLWGTGMEGAAAPLDNPQGGAWYKMDKDSVAYCSSVGYYFSREIQAHINAPVGIINVAVGDTEINRWIEKGRKHGSFTSTDGDLFNNRIYPLSKLNIKGIILYQGEADQYRTHLSVNEYSDAMAGLVDDYREIWGKDLPFYWAQLTRYKVDETLVREGQRVALSKVKNQKNTGMITLIDIFGNYDGETGSARYDIHPWGKKTVAERFAYLAKRDCYGSFEPATGPMYKSFEIKDNTIILTFECTGVLRVLPKEQYADKTTIDIIKKQNIDVSVPQEFEIAGADKKYYKAKAVIQDNKVILTAPEVENPMYARYAWGAYPEIPNLTDETNLPTPTFTTEDFTML